MKEITTRSTLIVTTTLLLSLATGCSDDRVAQVATQAADRQAEQNNTMAKLQQDVATGTQKLVTADAEARHEIVAVHHDLQAERGRLDANWNLLEDDRKQLAGQRRTESILVPAIELFGGLLLVATLLGFCWYVLVRLRSETVTDGELNELLVHELATGTLFASYGNQLPAQITHSDDRSLGKS
jgi:DNA gyrase/topoisomerase IV subunit A